MVDGATLGAIGGAVAIIINGYGTLRAKDAAERAVANTQNISNGFAKGVRDDLSAIRAHLASQDMHMVNQDDQMAELRRIVVRHDNMLTRAIVDDGR